jgi:hypothetical protein
MSNLWFNIRFGTLGTDTEYPFEASNHQLLRGTKYTIEQYTLKTTLDLDTTKESK